MAQVSITIHGREYTIACQDGQESILQQVATDFDAKVRQLSDSFPSADTDYLMVFANLMMADEIKALNTKIDHLTNQKAQDIDPNVLALRLENLAEIIENINVALGAENDTPDTPL